jgi:hypothetical protein
MNEQTPEQPTSSSDPEANLEGSLDGAAAAAETTVQPAIGDGSIAGAPKKNRLAWVSSPKVAAATVITALALGGLGGAFALGRATAGHDHDHREGGRILVGIPGGPGMQGGGGWGGGPMLRDHLDGDQMPQMPQDPTVTPSPSASSSSNG